MPEKRTSQGLFCFGGSFNPLHNGHLTCVHEVIDRLGFPSAMLVPSALPPHKVRHNDMASATDRLAFCQIAAAECPYLQVSDIELQRTGPSYTIDTVRQFKAMGWPKVHWLIGADMLMYFPKWYHARELLDEATIWVMARPGVKLGWESLPAEFRTLKANLVPAPLIDISATEIRRRVKAGLPIDELVPPGIAQYIQAKGLYRS